MPPLQAQVAHPEGGQTITIPMQERDRARAEAAVGEQSRTIALSKDDWSVAVDGTLDVIELLNDLRNICWDLSYAKDLDRPGVNSILRLAARAVESMEAKEIPVLDRLAHACLHADPAAVANRGGKA